MYIDYFFYLEAAATVRMISMAIIHLHTMNIAHRDLKVMKYVVVYSEIRLNWKPVHKSYDRFYSYFKFIITLHLLAWNMGTI